MTSAQLIGSMATLYGFGASLTILLQARQMRRRRSSCDVSARFFATYVGGYAIWLLYGLTIGSTPVILVHAVGLGSGALTLATVLAMRGSLRRPSTWNSCAPSN
jgi:MtN3 and saliva related transmembrane protein